MKRVIKKTLSIVLSFLMLLGVFPFAGLGLRANAANNYTIPFSWDVIRGVGFTTTSGPCAAYALAYARSILDGYSHRYTEYYSNGSCNWASGNYTVTSGSSQQAVLYAIYEQLVLERPCIIHVTSAKKTSHWMAVVGFQNVTDRFHLSMDNFLVLDSGTQHYDQLYPMSHTYRDYTIHSDLRYCVTDTPVNTELHATLSVDKTEARIEDVFHFTMTADKPSSYFWFTIRRYGTDEVIVSQETQGTFDYSFLSCGHYYAWCTATNGVATADSNWVEFYVYDAQDPAVARMKCTPSELDIGQAVSLQFLCNHYDGDTYDSYARFYMSMYDPNGQLCCSGWFDQYTQYSDVYWPEMTGTYTVHATAHTTTQNLDTEWLSFTVAHDWDGWTDNGDGTHSAVCLNNSSHVLTEAHPYLEKGTTVTFGSYPQTFVTDAKLIANLKDLVQEEDWQPFGFYYGDAGNTGPSASVIPKEFPSDWAQYTDVELPSGTRYRGIRFTHFRPYNPYCPADASSSWQDNNGVALDTVYWFRFDPIEWIVMDGSGYMIAKNVLDARGIFDYFCLLNGHVHAMVTETTSGQTSYDHSSLKYWLNHTFYRDTFSAEEKQYIKASEYDESGDMVSILSLDNLCLLPQSERPASATGYASYLGCYSESGHARYHLSTEYDNGTLDTYSTYLIDYDGRAIENVMPELNSRGVRPVIQLDLEKYLLKDATQADCVNAGASPELSCLVCGAVTHEGSTVPAKGHTDVCTVGETVSYGSYPQTRVTDRSLLSQLNAQTLSWQPYGYYHGAGDYGSMTSADNYMAYADVTYEGTQYRAVSFTEYRPYVTYTDYYSGADITKDKDKWTDNAQYNNQFYRGCTYWFRYEPIQWRVLSVTNGKAFVVCDQIIDSQPFNNEVYLSGNQLYTDAACTKPADVYAGSSIRSWYNNTFAPLAFAGADAAVMTTGTDFVRDMTLEEATNADYGFSAEVSVKDEARIAYPTDYAICQGVFVSRSVVGAANWGLQDKGNENEIQAIYSVSFDGGFSDEADMCSNRKGVRPVATFDFSSYQIQTTTAPDCVNPGVESAKCVRCGTSFERELPIAPDNHAFPLIKTEEKAPTCLVEGNHAYYQCSRCEKYFTAEDCATETTPEEQTIPKLPHSYTGAVKNDADGENGTHSRLCVNGCHQYGGATAHVWDEGIVTRQPTAESDGEMTYTCTVCGAVRKEPIPAMGWTVTFIDDDDSGLGTQTGPTLEEAKAKQADPVKAADAQYTYSFDHWDLVDSDEEAGTATFRAVYTPIPRTYTVTWKNDDGTVLKTDKNVAYGTTPTYDGATPAKAATEQYTYTFLGWTPTVAEVTGDATYTATFTPDPRTYTVTWKNDDGTVLETDKNVAYGTMPTYDGATPAKAATEQYTYAFSGWTPTVAKVTGDASYTATFTETPVIPNKDNKDIITDKTAEYDPATGEALITLTASNKGNAVTTKTYTPLDIVLVLDQSGSMGYLMNKDERPKASQLDRNRKTALQNAANAFIGKIHGDSLLGMDHRISVVGFAMGNRGAKATDEFGNSQQLGKYANTAVLSLAQPKQYDPSPAATAAMNEAYQASLVSVNTGGAVNPILQNAIGSLTACGATAADLGLTMACKVFEQNPAEGRKRVVVFMTDGEPTYLSDYDGSVASSAVNIAGLLKDIYHADVYSIGVGSSLTEDATTFLKNVCSNPADHYAAVTDAQELINRFTGIAEGATTYTTDFDHVTLVDTLSPAFTLTDAQEEALCRDAAEQLGVAAGQVKINRLGDGTTEIRIADIHPKEEKKNGETWFTVQFSFRASANEKALESGEYETNTEVAGVMIGDDPRFEQVFTPPVVDVEQAEGVIRFMFNDQLYAIVRVHTDAAPAAPEMTLTGVTSFSGWVIPDPLPYDENKVATLTATGQRERYTVTWRVGTETRTDTCYAGEPLLAPEVPKFADGKLFTGWDAPVPTLAPAQNLTFTAQFTPHTEHNFGDSRVLTAATCGAEGALVKTCEVCGFEETEPIGRLSHHWTAFAVVGEGTDTDYSYVMCENCGTSLAANLSFAVVSVTRNQAKLELSLRDSSNNYFRLNGDSITLTLSIPNSMNLSGRMYVYRQEENGGATRLDASLSTSAPTVTFTTDHFSIYLLRTEPLCNDTGSHPDTDGDGVCDDCGRDIASIEGEQQKDLCVCGKRHTGPFAGLIRFFHRIIYFFKNLFARN